MQDMAQDFLVVIASSISLFKSYEIPQLGQSLAVVHMNKNQIALYIR
jgi:hypothetical protein